MFGAESILDIASMISRVFDIDNRLQKWVV
jgi:hypothetical protein